MLGVRMPMWAMLEYGRRAMWLLKLDVVLIVDTFSAVSAHESEFAAGTTVHAACWAMSANRNNDQRNAPRHMSLPQCEH